VCVRECNVHYETLGDSNSKTQAPSIDTGSGSSATESVKFGKGLYHQWLGNCSGAWGTDCRTQILAVGW